MSQKFAHGWSKIETTEKIKNTADPNFKKPVSMAYFFEEVQWLRFRFEDGDEGDNDFIGEVEVKLGSIMGAKGAFEIDLLKKGKTGRGKLVVRAEAVKESRVHVNFMMEWFGMHTYMGGFCGMCGEEQDLYVEFTKMNEAQNQVRTWKSRDFKKYYEINDYAEGGQYLTTNHFEISE